MIRMLGLDPERVNVNGGAIALGHPLGCTGAKLTATLLGEMRRREVRYGMVTMCVGGGMGAAGIFERLIEAGPERFSGAQKQKRPGLLPAALILGLPLAVSGPGRTTPWRRRGPSGGR